MTDPAVKSPAWERPSTLVGKPRWMELSAAPAWRSLREGMGQHGEFSAFGRSGQKSPQELAGEAFKHAYEEGISRAKSTVSAIMERYHKAIAQIGHLRDDILRSSEEDLILLAMHIAHEAILSDDGGRLEFTVKMVEHAITLMRDAERITLRVGLTDYQAIHKRFSSLLAEDSRVRIVEDASIDLGGVIAESDVGRLDATLVERLRAIGEHLREERKARPGSPFKGNLPEGGAL